MELIRSASVTTSRTTEWREDGATVGLVPTMGALHDGHRALIRSARERTDRVLVTIFVNPLQFGEDEDLAAYPRDEAADLSVCDALGVDAVWAPPVEEMYPADGGLAEPSPGPVGVLFEGASRPGHFAGVLKAVHRLFSVAGPCDAFFGEKDAQQLFLIRRMIAERDDLPAITVVPCPTVREPDGLACSSRNARLSTQERAQAGCLFLALAEAAERCRSGERDARALVAVMAREIGATPLARLDYAAVVDESTFLPVDRIEAPVRAIVAARFGSVRLIDNLLLPV